MTRAPKSPAKTPKAKSSAGTRPADTPDPVPAPAMTVVEPAKAVVTGPELGKKDLIDRVVELSGVKKKDAKPVIEHTLAVLGQALSEGRELSLQPFGKVTINRTKTLANGEVLVARIRRSSPSLAETAGLAVDPHTPPETVVADLEKDD